MNKLKIARILSKINPKKETSSNVKEHKRFSKWG